MQHELQGAQAQTRRERQGTSRRALACSTHKKKQEYCKFTGPSGDTLFYACGAWSPHKTTGTSRVAGVLAFASIMHASECAHATLCSNAEPQPYMPSGTLPETRTMLQKYSGWPVVGAFSLFPKASATFEVAPPWEHCTCNNQRFW